MSVEPPPFKIIRAIPNLNCTARRGRKKGVDYTVFFEIEAIKLDGWLAGAALIPTKKERRKNEISPPKRNEM